jgi:hypothetical protein
MDVIRKLAWAYALLFFGVVALGYLPGLTNNQGELLGLFKLAAIPRYEAFTQIVPALTREGVRFVEIAGNDEIMATRFVSFIG